ncbi:hypothetical protein PoB_006263600 [Plakobranchus ocellatus]|uniref:Uncharacterized protein n=1 Tax=Plakobranchus ocellatus TaxID=259542 RepID=A0AAV4CW55_9GAST|nr:hypothetical protein PoB_006263600 [Plakobranchus ocellatus]
MNSVPEAQLASGHPNVPSFAPVTTSNCSGRFLPSIARRAGLYRETSAPTYTHHKYHHHRPHHYKEQHQQQQHHSPYNHYQQQFQQNVAYDISNDVELQALRQSHMMKQKPEVEYPEIEYPSAATTRRWIYRQPNSSQRLSVNAPLGETDKLQSELSQSIQQGCPQPPRLSRVSFACEDQSANRKLDRKAIARRHLVGGLTGGKHALDLGLAGGPREDTRSQSFHCISNDHNLCRSLSTSNVRREGAQTSGKFFQNKATIRRSNSMDKAREAIDNWNNLVHELQAEQQELRAQLSSHLAVLSDVGSSGGSNRATIQEDERLAVSGKSSAKVVCSTSLTLTDMKFPVGIGFTRYRPLTPNLLARLDKQKLPAKRRTQQWVNAIQETKRPGMVRSALAKTPGPSEPDSNVSCAIKRDNPRPAEDIVDKADVRRGADLHGVK